MLYVSCFEIGFSVADFWCDYLVKGKLNARGFKSLQSLHKDRLLLRSVMLLPVDLASRDADLLSASLLRGESKHLTICIRIACFEHAYVVIWGCLAKGFRSLEDNYRHSVDYLQPLYQTVSRTFCKLFADMQQVSLFPVFFFLWFQIAAQMQQLCISIEVLMLLRLCCSSLICCSSFVPAFTVSFRHAAALPLSCCYDFRLQHRCSSFVSALKHVFEPLLQ